MKRFVGFARALVLLLLSTHPASGAEMPAPLPPLREQHTVRQSWLKARLERVLPLLMRRHGVAMWIVVCREYNEDPVFFSLTSPDVMAARRRTILVFHDRGPEKGVERLALGGGSNGGLYTVHRDPEAERELWGQGQWVLLRKLVEERKPATIGINISHTHAFSDGLSAGEREQLETALGPWTSRFVRAENLAVSFGYDTDDLLTAAGSLSLTRHAQHGLLTGSTLGVVTDAWTYNGFSEPTAYSASTSGAPQLSTTYTRDALGRIGTLTETLGGVTDTYAYTYDAAKRLTGVQKNGAAVEAYTYDANGNRLSFTGAGGPITATHDAQDRLTQYGTRTYTYTAAGELQSKTAGPQVTSYSYDQLGNLLGATLPSGTAITYLVDGQQRQVGKQVNGALVRGFLYQSGLRPVAELDGTGAVVSRFVYDPTRVNVPAYLVNGGVTYRIITDHLGSVRLVVNTATGQIVQRMDYDAFGQVLADTSPGFQPFGFAGGLYDGDTKLVRFGARDYDPEAGRWTAKDPIGFAGWDENLYAYVWNDPVNFLDTIGLDGLPTNFTPADLPDRVKKYFEKNPIPPPPPPPFRPGEGPGRGDTIGPCPGPTNLERLLASARDRGWPKVTKQRIANDLQRRNSSPMSRQPSGFAGPPTPGSRK